MNNEDPDLQVRSNISSTPGASVVSRPSLPPDIASSRDDTIEEEDFLFLTLGISY